MEQAKEFHWNNPNGNRIYAIEWPVPKARAVVGLIHGVGEHCRRYDHMAAWFQAQGIAMVGYDRQGFGRSEGRKGYAANYSEYIDEIARLVVACETRYPDTPLFLYGHSMGGHLLLRYLIRRHPHISGAIVSAPHIRLSFQPNQLLVGIGRLLRNIYPTFSQDSQLDVQMLSRDSKVVADYVTDPLVHPTLTSKTGIDILENADILNDWSGEIEVPTLLMHGEKDGVTNHDATREFAERNSTNTSFKSWPGLYHEMHNEPEKEDVFRFVLEWLEERLTVVHRLPKSV